MCGRNERSVFFFGFSFFIEIVGISISYPSCTYGWAEKLNWKGSGKERKEEEKDRLLLLRSLAFEERRKRVGYSGKEG